MQSLFPKKTDLMAKQCAVLHIFAGPTGRWEISNSRLCCVQSILQIKQIWRKNNLGHMQNIL